MPGRGRGRGPGRGRVVGRGRRGRGGGGGAPPPQENPPAAAPAPAEKQAPAAAAATGMVCEYPRCEEVPSYGFPDSAVAQFCEQHKDDDGMVVLVANPDEPKDATIELVLEYMALKPKAEELKDAPAKANACAEEIKKLSNTIARADLDIDKLTKEIGDLNVNIEKEEKKPQRRIRGPLAQDPKKIEQWNQDKAKSAGEVGEIKGKKEMLESKLQMHKDELPGLMKPAKEYEEIHAKMMKLKADAVDCEPSYLYLAYKAGGDDKKMKAETDVIFERLLEHVEKESSNC